MIVDDAKTIYLSLGTNLGHRPTNLRRAQNALKEIMVITAVSPIYETAPWGVTKQPDYLNLCLAGTTQLSPEALLTAIKHIERELGRIPSKRWHARLIDIDILFYGNLIVNTPDLTIPHASLHQRAFVLTPLADIAPTLLHPVHQCTITQLLTNLDAPSDEIRKQAISPLSL